MSESSAESFIPESKILDIGKLAEFRKAMLELHKAMDSMMIAINQDNGYAVNLADNLIDSLCLKVNELADELDIV